MQNFKKEKFELKEKYFEIKNRLKEILSFYSKDNETVDKFINFYLKANNLISKNIGNMPIESFFKNFFFSIRKSEGEIYALSKDTLTLKVFKYNRFFSSNLEIGDIVLGFSYLDNEEIFYEYFEIPKIYGKEKIKELEKILLNLRKIKELNKSFI